MLFSSLPTGGNGLLWDNHYADMTYVLLLSYSQSQ